MSTKFIEGESTLEAAQAEDGGKWPRGSADKLRKLQDDLKLLVDRLRVLRGNLDQKGQQDIDSLFAEYLR